MLVLIFSAVLMWMPVLLCLTNLRTALSLVRSAMTVSSVACFWLPLLARSCLSDRVAVEAGYSCKVSSVCRKLVNVSCCVAVCVRHNWPLARERQRLSYPGPSRPAVSVPSLQTFRRPYVTFPAGVGVSFFRMVRCPYSRLGCQWTGQFSKLSAHESTCASPHKTGAELLEPLRVIDRQNQEDVKLYKMILSLMSCEHVVINGTFLLVFSWLLGLRFILLNFFPAEKQMYVSREIERMLNRRKF